MFRFSQALFSLVLITVSHATTAKECTETCQLEQVTAYFSALDKVARSNSTPTDIDALLALTHDDVKYIHVEYEANFTKDTWRKAFLRNLELGRYTNTDKNQIRILNSIAGKNHLAIEYSRGLIQSDGTWEHTEKYLAIFGFKEGKISLIKELW